MVKAFWWLRRFAGNFWYYYVDRQRWSNYPPFPLSVALSLAYAHTTNFKDRLAQCQNPAWGGEDKDYD
jgi:hypothetical protein